MLSARTCSPGDGVRPPEVAETHVPLAANVKGRRCRVCKEVFGAGQTDQLKQQQEGLRGQAGLRRDRFYRKRFCAPSSSSAHVLSLGRVATASEDPVQPGTGPTTPGSSDSRPQVAELTSLPALAPEPPAPRDPQPRPRAGCGPHWPPEGAGWEVKSFPESHGRSHPELMRVHPSGWPGCSTLTSASLPRLRDAGP